MNIFNCMKHLFFLFFLPYLVLSQEFYPGFLSEVDSPICYNTSAELSFQTLPSGAVDKTYNYQWQKSWNQSNWFDIEGANSINYTTNFLNNDTYYRVVVTNQNIDVFTNTISVYVLPPLVAGVLMDIDSICNNSINPIYFEINPYGAELNWGGFSEFSYAWQQGNINNSDIINLNTVDWVFVGDDSNIHTPNVDSGLYCFRCIISSPYGCGTVVTDAIIVQINDCFNTGLDDIDLNREIIHKLNILGQNDNKKSLMINVYNDGFVEKKYILR